MSTVKALDVAGYLVDLASKCDENDLTNLKLQKMLYFIQAEYYSAHGTPLFKDEIEAWDYGPVVRTVYNAYKGCGAFPITAFDVSWTATNDLTDEQKRFVEAMWEKWGIYSASHLVKETHKVGTPWQKHYYSDNKTIPVSEMRLESED